MSLTLDRDEGPGTVRLTGGIHLADAAASKGLLLEALSSCKSLTISLRAEGDLDLAALQLLFAAEREARKAGVSYGYAGDAEVLVAAAMETAGMLAHSGQAATS